MHYVEVKTQSVWVVAAQPKLYSGTIVLPRSSVATRSLILQEGAHRGAPDRGGHKQVDAPEFPLAVWTRISVDESTVACMLDW